MALLIDQQLNIDLPYGHVWQLSIEGSEESSYDVSIFDSEGTQIARDDRPDPSVLCTFQSSGISPYTVAVTGAHTSETPSPIGIDIRYLAAMPLAAMVPSGDLSDAIAERMTDELQAQCLAAHNESRLRENLSIKRLEPSLELAAVAQAWAEELVKNNAHIKHNPDRGLNVGENIYWSMGKKNTGRDPVTAWMNEKSNYDWKTGKALPGKVAGHYTQVVWANTTHVGCGMCRTHDGREIWVCNYSPAGNVVGERPYSEQSAIKMAIPGGI